MIKGERNSFFHLMFFRFNERQVSPTPLSSGWYTNTHNVDSLLRQFQRKIGQRKIEFFLLCREEQRMSGRNLIRSWFNLCLPWCCSLCSPFRESPEMFEFSLFSSHSHTQSQHNCITSNVAVDVVLTFFGEFGWIIFQNHNVEWQHTTFSDAANCSHLEVSWKFQNLFPWCRMKSCCAVNDPSCERCELLR